MLTYIQARNEMRKLFWDAWIDGITNGFPNATPPIPPPQFKRLLDGKSYIPRIEWWNVQTVDTTDNGVHWGRFTASNIQTSQSTLGGSKSRYTTIGVIVIQLFFSKSAYETDDADLLSMIAQNAFVNAKTPGGVWFRNSTIVELSPLETHFRSNVTVEYQYDSLKV